MDWDGSTTGTSNNRVNLDNRVKVDSKVVGDVRPYKESFMTGLYFLNNRAKSNEQIINSLFTFKSRE